MQPYNLTKLSAFNDRDLGALIVRNNGSTVSFSVDVLADPCPDIMWTYNGIRLGPSNNTFIYSNPCIEDSTRLPYLTFSLNVILTEATSGSYSANITNVAGTTPLPNIYITIPGMMMITINDIQNCTMITNNCCNHIFSRTCLYYWPFTEWNLLEGR